jgi:3-oxoacyl-[acyl-carrier protein] reductase
VTNDVSFDFTGRRVLVIGGSRGIGEGVVRAFAEAGAAVHYAARTPIEGPCTAQHHTCDIRNTAEIVDLFAHLDGAGGLDFLINVAAVNHAKTIDKIDVDEWDDVLDVNLRATFVSCREAAKRMKAAKAGRIVNVSSIAGRHRSPVSGVHYVSSKAGIIGLTRQLAFELAPFGVNVNVVSPSQTRTAMLQASMTAEQLAALEQSIPLGRVAEVEEQVGPILFLCSSGASYITGAMLDINGGQV